MRQGHVAKSARELSGLPPGTPYGHTIAVCGRCSTVLQVRVETNGDGGLVDVVEPCPTCAPRKSRLHVKPESPEYASRRTRREQMKARARREGAPMPPIERPCHGCGETFYQPSKTGRPFSYCTTCKPRAA